MQVTIEDLSPVKKKIGIALPDEDVRAEIEEAYRGLQQRARIKTRPGRVPRASWSTTATRSEAGHRRVDPGLASARWKSINCAVASRDRRGRDEAGCRAQPRRRSGQPTFGVSDYEGIEVERSIAPVDDAAVDAQIERFRQSLAQFARREDRDVVGRATSSRSRTPAWSRGGLSPGPRPRTGSSRSAPRPFHRPSMSGWWG